MLSASLRRLYSVSKSGSPGGIGRTFSARLNFRCRSSSFVQVVVAVPAVGAALVRVAVGADPLERHELQTVYEAIRDEQLDAADGSADVRPRNEWADSPSW